MSSKKLLIKPPSELQEALQEHEYWTRKLSALAHAKRQLDADILVAEKQVARWAQKIEGAKSVER